MKQHSILLILFFLLFENLPGFGQFSMYWVQFSNKRANSYSLEQPHQFLSARSIERRLNKHLPLDSTDLPVSRVYVDSIQKLGFRVRFTSRWLNGAIAAFADSIPVESLALPSFVERVELRKPGLILKSSKNKFDVVDSLAVKYYGNSYTQVSMLKGHILHEYSKGEGIHIAVIDAGFLNADVHKAFTSLNSRAGILGTFDFVQPGNNLYAGHSHGTSVLSAMAADLPGELLGTAPMASYWLLRTEDDKTEYPIEEDYWVAAAEFADSAGCDIINSSLGYSEFDDPSMNHSYADLNGKTLRISKAANMAVEKGILVFCSAGNEGGKPWKRIVAPAEAEKVIAVAAVDSKEVVTGFSSRGFGQDIFPLKPDLSAMGSGVRVANGSGSFSNSSGTSFSSPLLAGMAACLMALKPKMTIEDLKQLMFSYASRYPLHDSLYGYGIPDFERIYNETIKSGSQPYFVAGSKVFPNPFSERLCFEFSSPMASVSIFSIDGRLLLFQPPVNSKQLSLSSQKISDLPKGIYFVVLKEKLKTETFKLIKQ